MNSKWLVIIVGILLAVLATFAAILYLGNIIREPERQSSCICPDIVDLVAPDGKGCYLDENGMLQLNAANKDPELTLKIIGLECTERRNLTVDEIDPLTIPVTLPRGRYSLEYYVLSGRDFNPIYCTDANGTRFGVDTLNSADPTIYIKYGKDNGAEIARCSYSPRSGRG